MAHAFTGLSTADIYQGVINEVMKEVREIFSSDSQNAGADHVEFKRRWELAVEEAILFDRKPHKPSNFTVAPPVKRAAADTSSSRITVPDRSPRASLPVPTATQEGFEGQVLQQEQQVVIPSQEQQTLIRPQEVAQPLYQLQENYQDFQEMQYDPMLMQPFDQDQYLADNERIFEDLMATPMEYMQQPMNEMEDLFDAGDQQDVQQQQHFYYQVPQEQYNIPQDMAQGLFPPQHGVQNPQLLYDPEEYAYIAQFASPVREMPFDDENSMHQLDGNGDRQFKVEKNNKKKVIRTGQRHVKRSDAERALNQLLHLQLDGGGANGSDSEESELEEDVDDVEDDDEELQRVLHSVGVRQNGDSDETVDDEQPAEEDDASLNSADDDDEEDLETLFDVRDTIYCQFEKVHRARNKWKLNLKDGIMHIDNRDHLFHKAVGEAEF